MDSEIKVSVICTTYNHELYIRQCLDGFVMQKTDFRFEVIVHDDASTDRTAEIIREYAEKYPDIIVPIYQKENQYSQKKSFIRQILDLVKGQYIARCEGDDYWSDCYKLQKQYDFMEKNQNLLLCLHTVRCVNEKGEKLNHTHPQRKMKTGLIPQKQAIDFICNDFFQLTSYFHKKEIYELYLETCPQFKKVSDVGDIPLLLYLAFKSAYVGYINEEMSCYRGGAIGSWNSKQNNEEKWRQHYLCMENMYNEFDKYSGFKFHNECLSGIDIERLSFLVKKGDVGSIIKDKRLIRPFLRIYSMRTKASLVYHYFTK